MNDGPSPMSYMGGEGPPSPKRKKMRQKYAPKACVSCRRSKLKCTGEVPCQRCVDNGKRCFYSEDQTAAEVLQNLSRPTPTPTTQSSSFSNGNGHAASRLSAMPQNSLYQRRPSDNGPTGMTMEQRMARMEAMMEALVHERGLHFTPSGSLEREESVGHRSESAFSMPILDPIHPALDQMVQQPPEQQQQQPQVLATESMGRPDAAVLVRIAGQDQTLPFPDEFTHIMYVSQFFGDIHLRHPCVDETAFRERTSSIVTNGAIETTDIYFLALSYVIFACGQAVHHDPPPPGEEYNGLPGWRWYLLADSIIDKKAWLSGCNNILLIQYLLFQSLYFAYVDMPALAYSAIRTTCTAVLQQNLHQQSTWIKMEPEEAYQRVCVLWNVFVSDRAISLSCGRPASLNMEDMNIEMPGDFYNRNQLNVPPYDPFREPDHKQRNANALLQHELGSAQLASSLSSELHLADKADFQKYQAVLLNNCSPDIPAEPDTLVSSNARSDTLAHFMTMRRIAIGLIAGRKFILSLSHEPDAMGSISALVCSAVTHVKDNLEDVPRPSCKYQKTSVIAGALLVLGYFILQDCSGHPRMSQERSFLYAEHVEHFMIATEILSELAVQNIYARRVRDDFSTIISIVARVNEKMRIAAFSRGGVNRFGYEDAKGLIPPNIMEVFPYNAMSPDLSKSSGVVWLF